MVVVAGLSLSLFRSLVGKNTFFPNFVHCTTRATYDILPSAKFLVAGYESNLPK